jgi:hypothetical protein
LGVLDERGIGEAAVGAVQRVRVGRVAEGRVQEGCYRHRDPVPATLPLRLLSELLQNLLPRPVDAALVGEDDLVSDMTEPALGPAHPNGPGAGEVRDSAWKTPGPQPCRGGPLRALRPAPGVAHSASRYPGRAQWPSRRWRVRLTPTTVLFTVLSIFLAVVSWLWLEEAAARRLGQARRMRREGERLKATAASAAWRAVKKADRERSLAYQVELTRFAKVMSRVRDTRVSEFKLEDVERPRPSRRPRPKLPRIVWFWAVVYACVATALPTSDGDLLPFLILLLGVSLFGLLTWRFFTAGGRFRRSREELARANTELEAARLRAAQLEHLIELAGQQEVLVQGLRQQLSRDTKWLRSVTRRRRDYDQFDPEEKAKLRSAWETATLLRRTITIPSVHGELEPNPDLATHLAINKEGRKPKPGAKEAA